MTALLLNLLRLSLWLAILVVVFVPLERLFAVQPSRFLRKGLALDLAYYFLNSLLPAALLSVPAALLAWSVRHLLPATLIAFTAALPFFARALAALVAGEIGYYWGHRLSHEIPFLWRFHAVHHSAEAIDFLVNTRAHPLDMVFSRFCGLVPMYLLGLAGPTRASGGSALPVGIILVGTLWGFFVHANVRWRLGGLEWFLSTPMFHHWHHTRTGLIDHNYASMLPWIDRLFGTHILPKEWPEAYGIEATMPDTLLEQLAYPLLAEDGPSVSAIVDARADQPATAVGAND